MNDKNQLYHAIVTVTLRGSILDPQGKAVEHGIHSLGYPSVEHVRIGKHIEFDVRASARDEAERITREACTKLLANTIMEDFSIVLEVKEQAVHA